jgi:hypothetical protein
VNYRILSPSLHATADAAAAVFRKQFGFTGLKVEEPFDESINFRPTFHCQSADFNHVCIEISDKAFPTTLDAIIGDCTTRFIPVLFYVAISSTDDDPKFSENLKRAKQYGIGIVDVSSKDNPITPAVSLSLAGVRAFDSADFAPKYWQIVRQARETFRNGDPAKGCQRIYEELEDRTRKIARMATKYGWWKSASPNIKPNTPWYRVAKFLQEELNITQAGCPNLTEPLLADVMGATRHRNIVSHKPKSKKKLIERDKKLRTIFEKGVDLLQEVLDASQSIR